MPALAGRPHSDITFRRGRHFSPGRHAPGDLLCIGAEEHTEHNTVRLPGEAKTERGQFFPQNMFLRPFAASFTAFQISTDRSSPPLLPPPHYRPPPGHFRARARRRKRLVCVWVCVCVGSLRCADRRKMRPGVTRCHHVSPNVTGTHRSAPERTARALPGNRPSLRRARDPTKY